MNQTTTVENHIDTKYLKTCLYDIESFDIDESDESIFTSSDGSDNSLNISSSESEENKPKSESKENKPSSEPDIFDPSSDAILDTIPLEPKEITYSPYGKIVKPTVFKEKIWWVVDIYEPGEVKKLNKPNTVGISGMFLYEPKSDPDVLKNYRFFKSGQMVKVNITYNEKGWVLYMKNIIDMSDKLHLD